MLKYYEFYGYTQFVIALGYHADSIEEYFIETLHSVPVSNGVRTVVRPKAGPARTVELIDTGLETSPEVASAAGRAVTSMALSFLT